MNNMITAIILSDRNTEQADLTLRSLESFGGEYVERAVVVDYETDSDSETFIGFPTLLNQTVRDYDIETDFLIVHGGVMVTPETVKRLIDSADARPKAGVIAGVINGTSLKNQALPSDITDYKEAVEYSATSSDDRLRKMFITSELAFVIRKEVYDALGGFNEAYKGFKHTFFDYTLKLAANGYNAYVVKNAIFWNTSSDNRRERFEQCYYGEDITTLRDVWDMGYFNSQGNYAIIGMIDSDKETPIKVLEIGCSKGDTLLEISEDFPNSEVYGAEISAAAVKLAGNFCNIILNNIEEENLPYEEGFFDYIIFGDVLEHLHNPAKTLRYVKRFLKRDGRVIISVPNVQHISVVKDLLNGYFTYTPVGLLDSTHIHLFTYKELFRMLYECGYETCNLIYTLTHISEEERKLMEDLKPFSPESEPFMFEAFQYIVTAKAKREE